MESVDARIAEENPRKRPRAARACDWCRSKKYKCDERDPCARCSRARIPCIYRDANSFRHRISSGVSPSRPSPTRIDASGLAWMNPDAVASHRNLEDQDGDVIDRSKEVHGRTSILSFLAALQRSAPRESQASTELGTQALVSAFHNDSFSPQSASSAEDVSLPATRYYFRQSQYFLDGYFQNLHFIHPIIDRSDFFARCEELWFGRHGHQSRSFVALYFAVMSLGALTREWSEERIDGLGRWEWSRKLFQLASHFLGALPLKTDLETVQASIIMAKVCQNELNPSLSYTYLGLAVRTSLSAGHNRKPCPDPTADRGLDDSIICKTWWGLFSVEIETSFSLGRPDSLGSDLYHNCALPPVEDNEGAILTPMVDLARIIRKVAACVYTQAITIEQRIGFAADIEAELDCWVLSLPISIRPRLEEPTDSMGVVKDRLWAKKQRHTLRFRYYNVMMVLYRPFLLHVRHTSVQTATDKTRVDHAVSKCVGAARSTIRLMHYMYSTASYFRTWWYNTTYTLYAASIILGYSARIAAPIEKAELNHLISMSLEILKAMDENIVARKAADLLQATSNHALGRTHSHEDVGGPSDVSRDGDDTLDRQALFHTANDTAQELLFDPLQDDNFDFMAQIFSMNDPNFTF